MKQRGMVKSGCYHNQPGKFGKLKEDMDRTGRVDGPFKRLKVMRQAARKHLRYLGEAHIA
jgi:hypothetical protein